MMNDGRINRRKRLVAVIFVAIIVVTILISIGIATNWFGIANYPGKVIEKVDPVSGELLLEVDQEPEKSERVGIVGLGEVIEKGFSPQQQDILYEAVNDYFNEEQFNYSYVSYKKDSFSSNDDDSVFEFIMISNTGDKFRVILNTGGSYFDLDVKIEK